MELHYTVNFDEGVKVHVFSRIKLFHSFHFFFPELQPKRANFLFIVFILSTFCFEVNRFSILLGKLSVKPNQLQNLIRKYAHNEDLDVIIF